MQEYKGLYDRTRWPLPTSPVMYCCKQKNKQLTTVKNYRAVNPPEDFGEIINYKSRTQVGLYSHHNAAMEL